MPARTEGGNALSAEDIDEIVRLRKEIQVKLAGG
jgi:hypothetical protein